MRYILKMKQKYCTQYAWGFVDLCRSFTCDKGEKKKMPPLKINNKLWHNNERIQTTIVQINSKRFSTCV